MSRQPTLIVLAAGIGRRYGGLKQIEPIGPNGEILLDYSVYDALDAGFETLVFVIRRDIEAAFRQKVGRTIERHCNTRYAYQEVESIPEGFGVPRNRQKPWGTAHAVLICRDMIDAPFGVINADDFYGRSSFRQLAEFLEDLEEEEIRGCIIGYPVENTLTDHGSVARGVCAVNSDGSLVRIDERTNVQRFEKTVKASDDGEHWLDIPLGTLVSMNMWGFSPTLFAELEERFRQFLGGDNQTLETAEYLLPEVVGDLVQEGRAHITVIPTSERWVGVTHPEDRASVQQEIRDLIARGIYPENLWASPTR
ncbi:MAG TPA: sugar phosphate nucleotidyltransferase [Candidatus Heimdallarchaeota archaeon]|nr:sugar phosphate nucleotidyltransferase [Candidatus Heimdallarchaeota archaeon]